MQNNNSAVLYQSGAWSLTLREEVTEPERKLYILYFHDLYLSPNIQIIKLRRWAWHTTHGEKRNVYRVLVQKP